MSSSTNGTKSPKEIRIAVVGGGIGGLALTIGLLKYPHLSPHIWEAAPAFSEIGAGVASGANAVRAIGLIDERLIAAYKRCATYDASPGTEALWFNVRHGMPGRGNAEGAKPGEVIYQIPYSNPEDLKLDARARSCVHRAQLLDEMVKLIPMENVSFQKTFVDFEIVTPEERGEGGAVKLSFADGTTATADVVIGCDGIKSAVRKAVMRGTGREVEPVYTGDFAYRCLVPTEEAKRVLGEKLGTTGSLYSAYTGYSAQYPVSGGAFYNMIIIRRDPSWDPNSGEPPVWPSEQWVLPAGKETMMHDLKGWHPPSLELMERFSPCDRWALFHLPHNEPYVHSSGAVALMGDAAHASTPHTGAGAGMAMEDAFVLGNLFGELTDADEMPALLMAYDAVRRPRTQTLVQYSRRSGDIMMEVQNNLEARQEMGDIYKWIWTEDLEGELDTAKRIFRVNLAST
ncbi:FAD/NAD(P)-binding domain-containing protein [Rhizodiscina lignyota]|uniref:FAD/NAD(P)-binding domain-containing protein n=1 Tax=Rhizodiscina lignyota TaxID=1504668 RepID=A0A9P4IN86_9PEZI|nr:FAD/NAD(P)-binding domain-containing protein [Rhizodiscina lignyota]